MWPRPPQRARAPCVLLGGAVVTPLAQDAAAEHNMTILKDL